ncbi:MAG: hypothetical protein ABI895_39045, partial [Deltaproteobacteria bacterium]
MCQVQILSVGAIVPTGASSPTHLRVTGRLLQCPGGQVNVTSSITAASGPVASGYGINGDGFIVILPITAPNIACGGGVTVTAQCYQAGPGCSATYNGVLECCGVQVLWFDAVVTPGSLTPSEVRVAGTSLGCATVPSLTNDPVIVRVTFPGGGTTLSGPIPTDALSGAFVVAVTVPAGTVLHCDDDISVEAWCSTNTACQAIPARGRLDCPQCARAEIAISSAGPCSGNPPKQPITLSATINLVTGAIRFFKWKYGDGTFSPVFLVDNSGGTATTPHTVPPYTPAFAATHDYSPGTWSGELIVTDAQGNPLECATIPFNVVASCNQCAGVTVSATPGVCVNGKRLVTLSAFVNSLPATTAFQWLFGDGQQGVGKPVTATGVWPNPADPSVNTHEYGAGLWTATLTDILNPGCSFPVRISVDVCPAPCCPSLQLDSPVQVTGCAPGSAIASFNAKVTWPEGCAAVLPTSFEWTLATPSSAKYQKSSTTGSTDTSSGWHTPGGGAVAVQFATGGTYSIAVTAIVPGVSLPCNPSDTIPFPVPGCCPQLIGPLNTSQKPGDPCTFICSAQVVNPNGAAISFDWAFHDGGTATTALPQTEHTYGQGAAAMGTATVTLKSPNCPDQSLTAPVTQLCACPTIAKPGAIVTGCLPGTPMVTLSTAVTPAIATSFTWTVTTPGGATFTKTTTAPTTTDGTADGAWTDTSTGSTGSIPLGATGG